jgi:hypothetical protein
MVLNKLAKYNNSFHINDNLLCTNNKKETLDILNHLDLNFIALNCCEFEDKDLKSQLVRTALAETAHQIKLLQSLKKTITILADSNIETILLKGFAIGRYYQQDCLRPMSDIDLLVKPEDKKVSINILKNCRYSVVNEEKIEEDLNFRGEVELFSPKDKISIEIHWDFINTKSYRKKIKYDPEFVFNQINIMELDNFELNILKPEIDLVYLMSHHILHHQFKRPLWLVDVLLLLSDSLDFEHFYKLALKLKLEKPVFYYLNAVNILFPDFLKDEILHIKNRLKPQSLQYSIYSKFTSPKRIFIRGNKLIKIKDQVFRKAFK